MAKIDYKEGAEFPQLPTKTPILCKIIESEFIEDDPNPWFGKETGKFDKKGEPIVDRKEFRNLVKVIFESVEEDTGGSRIWFNATASIHEDSKLRPLLEAAAFAEDPTTDDLKEYDTDDLVGQYVYVTGSYGPKDEKKKFLRPDTFMRYKDQFKPGFKRPGKGTLTPAPDDDDDEGEDDEVKALKAKLAAAKAKKAAPAAKAEESKADKLRRELAELEAAESKPVDVDPASVPANSRKESTRDKAIAKTAKKAKAETEDPEAAF